jgi:hypothetical protein
MALGVMNASGAIIMTNGNDDGHGHFANTAPLSNLLYITPHNDANTVNYQGLVALATPEPSTAIMAVTGGIVIAGGFWRRRRANAK